MNCKLAQSLFIAYFITVMLPASSHAQGSAKPAASKQTAPSKTVLASGKLVYEEVCATCHQTDGSGVPHLNPPLLQTDWVLGDKQRLINVVLKGLNGVEIEGEMYGNAMPAFSHLTDKQIADVLTYVRNEWGNKASAVTAAEVKKERAKK